MPFLTVELDAVNLAADLGRASGLSEAEAGFGLIRMWAWCFRNESNRVLTAQLAGFFGGDPERVAAALASFGFLEELPGERYWRVKGADRYLRVAEARRKGGQAAKNNLIPGGPKGKAASAPAEKSAETEPGLKLGGDSALTPITDHRSPISEDLAAQGAAPQSGQGELIPMPRPGARKPREPSLQERAKAYFDEHRAKKTQLSDEAFTTPEINSMLKAPLEEYGRVSFGKMIDGFLADPDHAACGPPWPFRLFVKIHRRYHKPAATPKQGKQLTAEERRRLYE